MQRNVLTKLSAALTIAVLSSTVHAQLDLGTTDQSDGDIVINGNQTIDLNRAAPAAWNAASPVPGYGVYDGQMWAVVFKCHNLTIGTGANVTFTNRILGGNPPVVFLVQGQVQIDGGIGIGSSGSTPGPGGFGMGSYVYNDGWKMGGGRGPGGADTPGAPTDSTAGYAQSGSGPYAGRLYGNSAIIPLVGGSGAGMEDQIRTPGSGAGAILIACRNTLSLNGFIGANTNGGSGGSIKLVANTLSGTSGSYLQALSPPSNSFPVGSPGRIRLEFNTSTYAGSIQPLPSIATPTTPITIWPSNNDPFLVVEQVGTVVVPTDPSASWQLTQEDVTLFNDLPVTVKIHAYNVPLNWHVEVRVVPRIGATIISQAALVSGNQLESVWNATVTFPRGQCAIQARAWL